MGLLSDNEEVSLKSGKSGDSICSESGNKKSSRFAQYLPENLSDKTQNVLTQLSGDDAGQKPSSKSGICLDQAQVDILLKPWRCSNPERLSAYKEEYKLAFPIHESAESMFQVPSLDELLEPMLSKRHGSKMKGWGNNRPLVTQPLKPIRGRWHLNLV